MEPKKSVNEIELELKVVTISLWKSNT